MQAGPSLRQCQRLATVSLLPLHATRFRAIVSRYLINYSGWQRVLDDRRLTSPVLLLWAAVQFGKQC